MSKPKSFLDLKIDTNQILLEAFEKMAEMVGAKVDDLQRQIDELKADKAK